MNRLAPVFLAGFALLVAAPAEARFGKKKAQPADCETAEHPAQPAAGAASSGDAAPAPAPSATSYRGWRASPRRYGPAGLGFWAAAFVPQVVVAAAPGPVSAPPLVVAEPAEPAPVEEPEQPSGIRLGAGVEGMGFRNGFTLGVAVGVEGERWGLWGTAQNIAVRTDDGTPGFDHLQVATAHLSFAFLTGRFGRLRVEGGADAVFAPNMIAIGPTGGLSGTLWVGGPFAIEGAAMVTPWPYLQLDGKLGLAVGLGPLGLRAGVRAQLLDDRGLVDGVVNRDLFVGPYVGAALVF